MVRFYAAARVRSVDVEGIEVGANLLEWREALYQQSC